MKLLPACVLRPEGVLNPGLKLGPKRGSWFGRFLTSRLPFVASKQQPLARGLDLIRGEVADLAFEEGRNDLRPGRHPFAIAHDSAAAEIVEMSKTEFEILPECGAVHALEVFDNLEHVDLAVPRNESLEFLRGIFEFLRRDEAFDHDLDREGVVVFLVGQHGPSPKGPQFQRSAYQIERRRTRALDGGYQATSAAMRCANRPLNCRGLAIHQSSPSLA